MDTDADAHADPADRHTDDDTERNADCDARASDAITDVDAWADADDLLSGAIGGDARSGAGHHG